MYEIGYIKYSMKVNKLCAYVYYKSDYNFTNASDAPHSPRILKGQNISNNM